MEVNVSREEQLLAQEISTKSITIAKYQKYVEELEDEIKQLKENQQPIGE
ncbi:hypothetical protein MUA52_08210 [Staphylococcus agnetis]|nr:hypothetical protein [Staphylococcus agnetis]UXU63525.1 hypothetical protein MUA84_08275 [Staphylococcus agnetis]UXU65807.1 hypothetical protein MUA52_08210 [Staphylococcus agnetis]